MEERENILSILKGVRRFIQEDNPHEIKELSNRVVSQAAITQNPDTIVVAVLVYSIGKVLEREYYRKMHGWDLFYSSVTKNLNSSIKALERGEIDKARVYYGRIRNSINSIEGNLGIYIKDIFRKAEINKAFKLYEHGLSSEQTANLLGISLWDLSSYIGQSHISNAKHAISLPIKKRIKIAEDIFG
ncbi:MAG: hypothetical protein IH845_04180 [Nanoarchaeota archaeon]|nr:hypothetical protein [Nanoarchaeota archaeon]